MHARLCTHGTGWMIGGSNTNYGYRAMIRWKTNPNYCIDVPNASPADGVQLQAYPCHGGANQTWDMITPQG